MPRFPNIHQIVSTLIFMLVTVQLSHAAATITVDQSGVVTGSGMDGIAGIELVINYDSSNLSTPTVTKGSLIPQSMLAANTSVPGVIRIAIISTSPFSGSGQIAAIKFASNSGKGWIKLVSHSMINAAAVKIPVDSSTPDAEVQPASQATTTTTSPSAATVVLGNVNYTTTQTETPPARVEAQTPEPAATIYQKSAPPQLEPDNANPPPAPVSRQTVTDARVREPGQQIIYKGILDRFKTYRGDKSLPFMAALFRKEISQFVHQEPEVAVSDGKSRIRIIVDLPNSLQTSPNFALDNATIISARKDSVVKGRWIIEALPETAAWKATLSIIAGEESFEYPLTVTPPLGSSLKADQSGWNVFLKETGTPQKPLHDFNHDGLRDYIDEFIFVANHLAEQ